MPPSDIRKEAKEALAGKWGKGISLVLAYFLIAFILEMVLFAFKENPWISLILDFIITLVTVPISYGLLISFMKLTRGDNTSAFDFIEDGFKNFIRSWKIELWTFIKLLIPIICLIVITFLMLSTFIVMFIVGENFKVGFAVVLTVIFLACIVYIVVRSLLYSLSQFIAIDNPEMTAKESVLKSQELMTGNRGALFLLAFSFIGWILLSIITFGIGLLWIVPYMQVATICFYDRLKSK